MLEAKIKKIPKEVEEEIYRLRAVINSGLVEVLKIDLLTRQILKNKLFHLFLK